MAWRCWANGKGPGELGIFARWRRWSGTEAQIWKQSALRCVPSCPTLTFHLQHNLSDPQLHLYPWTDRMRKGNLNKCRNINLTRIFLLFFFFLLLSSYCFPIAVLDGFSTLSPGAHLPRYLCHQKQNRMTYRCVFRHFVGCPHPSRVSYATLSMTWFRSPNA